MARERSWIILAEDGRHVTVGCRTDPSEDEIERSASQLRSLGLGGWLAVTDGDYYEPEAGMATLKVRELAPTAGATWDEAKAAFLRLRTDAVR